MRGNLMTPVWQMAAGDAARDYTGIFLKHDVMFMGPGRFGKWDESIYRKLAKEGLVSNGDISAFKALDTQVKSGDIVLLRNGSRVMSLGVIADAKLMWLDVFDDVYGWDLQHSMRVIWQRQHEVELAEIQEVGGDLFQGIRMMPTFTAVHNQNVTGRIEHLFEEVEKRPLKRLPKPLPPPLEMDELGEALFSKGIPNEAVDKVLVAIQRQRRLTKWYDTQPSDFKRPTEHEVVAHMILPLMLALGWSEQLLAVEWQRVDLAAFWGTPTTPEHCALVCEAKVMGHGLQKDVFSQAVGYTKKLKLTKCKKIAITDGKRLYLFQRKGKEWNENPVGYLNVNKIRTNHIAPANTSAVDTIVALTPAGVMRQIGE